MPSPTTDLPQTWNIAHRGCEARWSSPVQAHCGMCCSHFATGAAFERHLLGGKCQDPATLPVFKQIRRKNCNIPIWMIDDGKDDDAG